MKFTSERKPTLQAGKHTVNAVSIYVEAELDDDGVVLAGQITELAEVLLGHAQVDGVLAARLLDRRQLHLDRHVALPKSNSNNRCACFSIYAFEVDMHYCQLCIDIAFHR